MSRLVTTHSWSRARLAATLKRFWKTTVRTLRRLDVLGRGRKLRIVAEADGFLYKMVRSLAGHLIRVGLGAVPAAETAVLLDSKRRTARVETAPAHGLCLWKIHYGAIPGLPKPDRT